MINQPIKTKLFHKKVKNLIILIFNYLVSKNKDNFVFNVIKNSEREYNRKPQILNKAFIQEETETNVNDQHRISRLSEKIVSMKKPYDMAT
jgi:hypothetical protein